MTPTPEISEPVATGDLVKRVLDEARELAKLEVAIAKAELKEDLSRATGAAIAAGFPSPRPS